MILENSAVPSNCNEESNENGQVPKRTIKPGVIYGASIQNTEYLSIKITAG